MALFEGGFSPETSASVPRVRIKSVDDLYPDRQATPAGTDFRGNTIYPTKETGVVPRLFDIPTTTKDMSKLFQWEEGDEIRGDHAKDYTPMIEYARDIMSANQDEYRHIFINTMSPIGPQLKKFKKIKR